jgi:hypothetical protein
MAYSAPPIPRIRSLDATCAAAILDRLVHNAYRIELRGEVGSRFGADLQIFYSLHGITCPLSPQARPFLISFILSSRFRARKGAEICGFFGQIITFSGA